MVSKSPSQFSLPRSWRMLACWCKRKTVRNPSSTISRLVLSPVARSASFINLSSISMLVRMMCIFGVSYTHSIFLRGRNLGFHPRSPSLRMGEHLSSPIPPRSCLYGRTAFHLDRVALLVRSESLRLFYGNILQIPSTACRPFRITPCRRIKPGKRSLKRFALQGLSGAASSLTRRGAGLGGENLSTSQGVFILALRRG